MKGGFEIKNLFFAIAIFALLITGCMSGADGPEKAVVGGEGDFPPSMSGGINVNKEEYEMEPGNYRWERKKGSETQVIASDAASPNQIAENFNAILLEPNTNIKINVEENPDISVYLWTENDRDREIKLKNNRISAPARKGKYIYEVLSTWSNGEVSYTFVVEVN